MRRPAWTPNSLFTFRITAVIASSAREFASGPTSTALPPTSRPASSSASFFARGSSPQMSASWSGGSGPERSIAEIDCKPDATGARSSSARFSASEPSSRPGTIPMSVKRRSLATQSTEAETALALQRAILGPSRLPTGFAVRYEPATRPLEVGGDWYDIVELPDGRIGIMVGDCVGHDLGAATVMGQLRSACRALLLQDASASQALTAMDRFASSVPGAECATVFCGILDPATGSLRYSSAAHPPGIVVHPDGNVVLLDGARSLPLAIRQDAGRTDADYVLPPRSTLLLYTDGLVERRGQPLTGGITAAGAAMHEDDGASLEELASQLMTGLAPAGGYEDDVALVLYHHPAPLDVLFSAESEQLASVRATLRGWLRSCDVGARLAQDVLVAAGEAIANAIEHGHRHLPGRPVRLRAVSTANQLRLTITDSGRWRTTPPGDRGLRGHGIALMRALMQQVTIEPGPSGTTVDMYVRINRGHPA